MKNYLCINFSYAFAEAFFGDSYNKKNFKVVSYEENGDITLNRDLFSMSDINRNLPVDWEPDIIFVLWPEWHTVPRDLFLAKIPIVDFISDWNLTFSNIKSHIHLYDCVFMDKNGTKIFTDLGCKNVHYAPLYSFDPKIHYPDESMNKDIDISLVGNVNHEVQVERVEWLKRLVMLKKEGIKVKIFTNVFAEQYTEILQRSKIVFNRGIRLEMNLRAYEGPAAGALLMMEEDNQEITDHLKPHLQYVPYNESNFNDLVKYYIENTFEREQICKQGHLAIVNNDSYTHHFSLIMDKINELSINNHLLSRERKLSEDDYKGLIIQAFNSVESYKFELCLRLMEDASLRFKIWESSWWLNARACLVFLIAFSNDLDIDSKNQYAKLSISLWSQAINLDRNFLSMFNLFMALFLLNEDQVVQDMETMLVQSCITSNMNGFDGLILALKPDNLKVENERARYSSKINGIIQANVANVFLSETYEILGKSYQRTGKVHEAINSFNRSVSHRMDNVNARTFLSSLLIQQQQFPEAVLHLKMVINLNPFQMDAVLDLCKVLKAFGPEEEFVNLVKDYILICDTISLYSSAKELFEALLDS